jgi:hypothetical protein
MSGMVNGTCQCWCYRCSGQFRSRNTFIRHGRKDAPDEPLVPVAIEMVSMQEEKEVPTDLGDDGDSPPDTDDDQYNVVDPLGALTVPENTAFGSI